VLAEVLSLNTANRLIDSWARYGDTFTVQWLQSKQFSVELGRKVLAFFGKSAKAKVEEDPYRLLSFSASWKAVDQFARRNLGVTNDDSRRLAGAVEEALHGAFNNGHTCLIETQLASEIAGVLGSAEHPPKHDTLQVLVRAALGAGEKAGAFIRRGELFHAPGPYLMELEVAKAVAARVASDVPLFDRSDVDRIIEQYESDERARDAPAEFGLNSEQRQAVIMANHWQFVCITGGAGTGKTTVLRCLFQLYKEAGYIVHAMALSGRAAKRITEATGHQAMTIARFLKNFGADDLRGFTVLVIDEASMVDLPSIYTVVRRLAPETRVVLVGDPHQLAPVGPGLLLHELVLGAGVPIVELKQVKRYGGGIATAASDIRDGIWPQLPEREDAEIAFLNCDSIDINEIVLRQLCGDPQRTQILSPTRNSKAGGVNTLNDLCQETLNRDGEPLVIWHAELGQHQLTGLRVGDPIICTKNFPDLDLQNGSLGFLVEVEDPREDNDPTGVLAWVDWDNGERIAVTPEILEHLERSYSITIHKSQGSQFHRVIVPITKSQLLDRTLLYTAITRAQSQVILVGDVDAARAAVLAPRKSDLRQVALRALLLEELDTPYAG